MCVAYTESDTYVNWETRKTKHTQHKSGENEHSIDLRNDMVQKSLHKW